MTAASRKQSRDRTILALAIVVGLVVVLLLLGVAGWFTGFIKPSTVGFLGLEDQLRQAATSALLARNVAGSTTIHGTVTGFFGKGLYFQSDQGAQYLLFDPQMKIADRIGRVVTLEHLFKTAAGGEPLPAGTPAVLHVENGRTTMLRLERGFVTP